MQPRALLLVRVYAELQTRNHARLAGLDAVEVAVDELGDVRLIRRIHTEVVVGGGHVSDVVDPAVVLTAQWIEERCVRPPLRRHRVERQHREVHVLAGGLHRRLHVRVRNGVLRLLLQRVEDEEENRNPDDGKRTDHVHRGALPSAGHGPILA
mgnify:CR=1 FL=1